MDLICTRYTCKCVIAFLNSSHLTFHFFFSFWSRSAGRKMYLLNVAMQSVQQQLKFHGIEKMKMYTINGPFLEIDDIDP